MLGSILGSIVNIILDPIFIFGLKQGAAGAAIATVFGNLIADIYEEPVDCGKRCQNAAFSTAWHGIYGGHACIHLRMSVGRKCDRSLCVIHQPTGCFIRNRVDDLFRSAGVSGSVDLAGVCRCSDGIHGMCDNFLYYEGIETRTKRNKSDESKVTEIRFVAFGLLIEVNEKNKTVMDSSKVK